MSEFTKGPWTARHPLGMEGMYHVFIYGSEGKKVKLGRIDGYVDGTCCGEKGYPDKDETVANAHLIASAPDMYEALMAVRNDLDGYTHHDSAHKDIGHCECYLCELISIIDPALAKAEGEE